MWKCLTAAKLCSFTFNHSQSLDESIKMDTKENYLKTLNEVEGFFIIKKAEEMIINKFYEVKSLEMKTTVNGERMRVKILDEGVSFAVFLSPLYALEPRKSALFNVFNYPNSLMSISVTKIEIRNGLKCITFAFKSECIEGVQEAILESESKKLMTNYHFWKKKKPN